MTVDLPPGPMDAIAAAASSPSRRVTLHLVTCEGTELGRRLAQVARHTAEQSGGRLALSSSESEGLDEGPALVIRAGGRDVVRYQAVPEGPEAAPFADALEACATAGAAGAFPELVDAPPTELTVFIAATCPNCPTGVRAAATVAAEVPAVSATVVDVAEFPERADRFGVRSVPTIITDSGLTVVGAVTPSELASRLAEALGPAGDAARFGSLVDAGRFDPAGELLAGGRALHDLVARWRSTGMGGRIGLMMAAEAALERSEAALDPIVPDLLQVLGEGDAALRGDTADLLGRIGHSAAVPVLEPLAEGSDEDLAEAAADALESIRERARTFS